MKRSDVAATQNCPQKVDVTCSWLVGGEEKVVPVLRAVKTLFKNQIKQKNHRADIMQMWC